MRYNKPVMVIYGTAKFPISCGTKGLSRARVALTEDVIDHGARDGVGHHDVDVVVSPMPIDMQEGWANAFKAVTQANCQAVTWNILRPYGNFDPVQLQSFE
jgi:hypothetical protein